MKLLAWILIPVIGLLGAATTVWAIDTSTALWTANISFLNLGISQERFAVGQQISGSALIDDGFMEADTLNGVIHEGATQIASMPPNTRIIVEGAVINDGGVFTDITSEAQSPAILDAALLPLVPSVGDERYFGCHNPCRIVTVDIGQEGIGGWSVTWEYFNGTSFVTASNVDDRTNAFKLAGQRTVSFDMPTDFATTTITGSGVSAFWVRARVDSIGVSSQQAISNQEFYENGQWWMWAEDLNINSQLLYSLSTGGADLVTNHQIFPGTAGIVTADAANIELGDDYAIHWEGAVAFVTGSGVRCILCKGTTPGSPFRLFVSNDVTNELTLEVNGGGTTTLTLSGIPDATTAATGSHVIDVLSDGTDVSLVVDGVGTATGTAQNITDTGDNYEWMSNGAATFGNTMHFLATAAALASDIFDTEAEWDAGALTEIISTPGQPTFELVYNPRTGVDDGMWIEGNSEFFNTSTNIFLGFDGNGGRTSANGFWRFDNVQIANGETVIAANLHIDPNSTLSATTVNLLIRAIDEDDANAPSTFAAAEAAIRTTASTAWNNVPTFTIGTKVDTPDFAPVIQEIVDRPGWVIGNSIVIYVEDNGSTAVANTFRFACTFEAICGLSPSGTPVKLQVTTQQPIIITDDFIELKQQGFIDGEDITGWTITCGGCREALITTDRGEQFGKFALLLDSGVGIGTAGIASQTILNANPSEIWSFGFTVRHPSAHSKQVRKLTVTWRDSLGATISDFIISIPTNSSNSQILTSNGNTAPAGTASVNLTFRIGCDLTPGNCTQDGKAFIDGVIACVCGAVPAFPDTSNRVTNPSFEDIFASTGTWVSPTINPLTIDVNTSLIAWDAIAPAGTTVLIETSIDNQVSFQTATNGGSIPKINKGDNLAGSTLHLRVTLQPNASDVQSFSPITAFLFVTILGAVEPAQTVLFYELRTTPAVTIDDLSPNNNLGTMSYPVQKSGIFTTISPLNSTRTVLSQFEAVGSPEFAASITGSAADLNFFGQDSGDFIPGGAALGAAFSNANLPITLFWVILIMLAGIAIGAVVWNFSGGNILYVSVVFGLILTAAAWAGDGLIPGWSVIVTLLLLTVLNIIRARLPL